VSKGRFIRRDGLTYYVPPALAQVRSETEEFEPSPELRRRALRILAALRETYPDASCALRFRNPLELLVATVLSAKVTDSIANQVAEGLFRKYRTAVDYATAPPRQLERDILPIGLHRGKARTIHEATEMIVEQFDGAVPDNIRDLLRLPGVGRKTANLVLGVAFGKNEGVIVDTHVQRVAQRLGVTEHSGARRRRIEQELMVLVPRADRTFFALAVIIHGRQVCTARRPRCRACPLRALCPSAGAAEEQPAPI